VQSAARNCGPVAGAAGSRSRTQSATSAGQPRRGETFDAVSALDDVVGGDRVVMASDE
jgi:hypothetical protein